MQKFNLEEYVVSPKHFLKADISIPTFGLDRTVDDIDSISYEDADESIKAVNKFKSDLESGRYKGECIKINHSGFAYYRDIVIRSLMGFYRKRTESHMKKVESVAKFVDKVAEQKNLNDDERTLLNIVEFDLSAVLFSGLNHNLGFALHHNSEGRDISCDLILAHYHNSMLVKLVGRTAKELELRRPPSFMESFYSGDVKPVKDALEILKQVCCPQLEFEQESDNVANTAISSKAFRDTYRAVMESKKRLSSLSSDRSR